MVNTIKVSLFKDIDLIWIQEFTSVGINFISNLNDINELNLKPKLLGMDKLCTIWQSRT